MLLALAFFLVQAAELRRDQEVVITSEKGDQAHQARRYIESVTEPGFGDPPLARFSGSVCVATWGQPQAAGQIVVDRISSIAASLGLRMGETGCSPNLLVAFVEDSREAVRQLARGNSGALKGQTSRDIKRIVAEPGHARSWREVELRGRDGERPFYSPDQREPPMMRGTAISRLSSPIRLEVVSATVFIDRSASSGRDLNQMADYAAMRALGGVRLRGRVGDASILALFTPDGDKQAPRTLTKFDLGYLKGLYAGRSDLSGSMKKQSMVSYMLDEKRP
ncbi:hypothetical protein [Sphingomonas sp. S2-65]|uniref:hypothetical protein n=1 Tax=Sphingomonas sp. S2-65 TaxID=2903960 RepID=UPI001F1BBFC3|nr:hypothetical protein [Sphingomonas sp. S2-65]UYY59422.1 hypothetical protein LZ586_04875 [Sphingomonas sp. S2-65]